MKILISIYQEQEFSNQLNKLNKFAEKHGFEPLKVASKKEVIREVERCNFVIDGRAQLSSVEHFPIPCVEIDLTGDIPVFDGWRVVAEVRKANGEILCTNDEYTPKKLDCDHCKTNRNRIKTYILKHADGTVKQVASACVQHFLGKDLGKFFEQVQLFRATFERVEDNETYPKIDLDHCFEHVVETLKKYTTFTQEEMIEIWEKHNSVTQFFVKNKAIPVGLRKNVYEPIYAAQEERDKKTAHFGVLKERVDISVLISTVEKLEGTDKWSGVEKTSYLHKGHFEGCPVEFYHKEDLGTGVKQIKATVARHKYFRERRITYLNRVKTV